MALNTRLTQNIDLQADGSALVQALGVIEKSLNNIVGKSGELNKELAKGSKAGSPGWNAQLKQLNILIGQAQNLQKLLDAQKGKKAAGMLGGLDEQALGKKGAAASRLAQDLTATSTAADVLEKRLGALNKRFAELTLAGRTVGQRDLAKQFNTENALKDVRGLEREFAKLNGQSTRTNGTREQQQNMARLRGEIAAANAELAKMGQSYRRSDFGPQIAGIRALTEEYRRAVTEARKFELAQPGRAMNAQRQAVGILNQSDASRMAEMKRASSGFQFPQGISDTVSRNAAEKMLADSLNKRLRLLDMIQKAQDRGAPTRSVERLNDAYKKLSTQLGENFKRLTQVNAEIDKANKQSFSGQFMSGLGRAGIIAGASFAVAGVYTFINAVKQATQFVVEYDAALKQLQAISGSTDQQMESLAKNIGEVGRNSTFSILEITKAATVIAQAGYSAAETGKVLSSAVTLSTASGSSPTESVEVLTSALGAFQLQAGESERVVDTLVTGLNKSKLSIEQMGAALQYAGATANESGVRFEELTAIAASMANAGIRSGSTIGTGLRQLLVDMKTPTEDFKKALKDVGLTVADVDVKTKGFATVVKTLADAGFTAEAAYSSFETRAASAFLAFKGQIDVYDDLALAIARGGAAAEAQAKSMDSLSAQFTRLKNDLGVVAAALAGPIVDGLKVLTSVLASLIEGVTDTISWITNLTSAIPLLNDTIFALSSAGIGGLIGSMTALGGPVGALIGLVFGLASAFGSSSDKLDELRTKTSDAEGAFQSSQTTVNNLDTAISSLIDRQSTLKDGSTALQTETVTLAQRFEDLYQYLGKSAGGYNDLLNAMLRYRGEALKQQGLEAQTLKTNATIERDATQQKLRDSAGRGGILGSYTQQKSTEELVKLGGKQTLRIADQGLNSNDIAVVTTARNFVARENAANNGALKNTLYLLEERLILVKKIASLDSQINIAGQQIEFADAASSPEAVARNGSILNYTRRTNTALSKAQSGDDSLIAPTIASLERGIARGRADLEKLREGTGAYRALNDDIIRAQEQLARLKTSAREQSELDAKVRPPHATKGLNLTGTQVKAELQRQFKGANVYSEKPRSLETQKRLYANYKAGRGPLAAKPGTSNHGSGHAIDMTPLAGQSIDDVTAYLESLGLEVTERLNERDPKSGRYHWHFAWKPKTSSFQKQADSQAARQATALQELRNAQATQAVGKTRASIQAVISKSKAGTDTAANLTRDLATAVEAYKAESIKQYDTAHPTTGLTAEALQVRDLGRADLIAKIDEETEKFSADLYRQIGDNITKTLQAAQNETERNLKNATYEAEAPVRAAQNNLARAGSRLNKGHIGAGTSYYLQQQAEAAQLNADRANVDNQTMANARNSISLGSFKTQIDALPDGEDKTAKLEAYKDAMLGLADAMRVTEELQQSINDRTSTYTQLPLEDRLKNAALAWAENSGVMQSWTDIMENNVGPALDMMTSTLTSVFTQIMQGSASIKGVLTSIISAVGQFVVQLIAKALALAAIKWFLSLIGVELVDTPGGVGIAKKAPGKLGGGILGGGGDPAPTWGQPGHEGPPIKRLNGGPAGYISQGVFNKDTVPILGARGEFMLRKSAVDSLGLDNVEALNRHGAKAMGKIGGATIIPQQSRQEMNLYVVKPEDKPVPGPKDMVIAITDDMLQGGITKQLVRKIAQGGM